MSQDNAVPSVEPLTLNFTLYFAHMCDQGHLSACFSAMLNGVPDKYNLSRLAPNVYHLYQEATGQVVTIFYIPKMQVHKSPIYILVQCFLLHLICV